MARDVERRVRAALISTPNTPYELVERESPAVGFGQVKLRVRAASLNHRDLYIASNPKQSTPRIPLSDGAGEIIELGGGVTGWQIGDRVAPNFFPEWIDGDVSAEVHDAALGGSIDGMLAEEIVVPAPSLVRIPDWMSFEQAATLPCAAVTAWNAMFESGSLRPGELVLLLGTGGVSIFALQFAKLAGAKVILTSSSDEKIAQAKALGEGRFAPDETINYRETPEWDRAVREITGGRGVDQVIEVGGAGTLQRSLSATRTGGTVSLIGVLTGGTVDPRIILQRSQRVQGIYVGSRAMFQRMMTAIDLAKIEPVIDATFSLEQANEAVQAMETARHFGKLVITI